MGARTLEALASDGEGGLAGHLINVSCGLGAHARHGRSGEFKNEEVWSGSFVVRDSEMVVAGGVVVVMS